MSRTDSIRVPLGIRGQTATIGDHIAYFWEFEEEFEEGVRFLETGLRDGDYTVVFGHPDANQKVLSILAQHGFSQASLAERVAVLGGKQRPEEMLSAIQAAFERGVQGGARLVRLLGNIGWGHPDWPSQNKTLQFEADVTEACRMFPCIVVCMYDVKSLPGSVVVRGGLYSHPLMVCGDSLKENPHFVPAAQYSVRYLKET